MMIRIGNIAWSRSDGHPGGLPEPSHVADPTLRGEAQMIFEIVKRVLENLVAYRKRSLMTVLGVMWGIASFILLMAYGDGFQKAMMLGLSYFGDNVVVVWNGQTSMQAGGARAGRVIRTEPQDIEMIRQRCTLVKRVSPEVYDEMPLRWGDRMTTAGDPGRQRRIRADARHVHGRRAAFSMPRTWPTCAASWCWGMT